MSWNGTNTDSSAFYKSAQGSLGKAPTESIGSVAAQIKEEVKKEETKVAPAKAPVTAKPKPAVKAPVKVLRFKTWEISNYGDETIVFPAAEVNSGMTFNFFNCLKTKIVIEGRCKNIMLSRCKKVHLTMEDAMSQAEIMKCEDMKFKVLKKCPTISVELCNGVVIEATDESKRKMNITTTASQSVSMNFPKNAGSFDPNDEEADPNKQAVIPETYLSKLNDKDELTIEPQLGID